MAMPWRETSPGHYQRPVGENEKFMTLLIAPGAALGREQWAISSVATFRALGDLEVEDLETVFRNAWKHLRFQHPSIASYERDDTLNYHVPDAAALDKWCEESFRTVTGGNATADDVIASHEPTKVVTMHYLPSTSQLVLRTSHWRTDGIGILMLFNAFFNAANMAHTQTTQQLPSGQEVARLAPNVESAANMPTHITEDMKATADSYASTFGHYVGCVGVKFTGDGKATPRGTRSARVQFSEALTTKVIAATKARGIGITSAIQAAVAGANYMFSSPATAQNHFASTMRFSLRPLLPEPYSTPAYASGLYTTGYISRVPASNTWAQNATKFEHAYCRGLSREFLQSYRQYAANLQAFLANMPADAPPLSNVDLSNVGVIDELVRPVHGTATRGIEVADVTAGVETLTPQMVVFAWTFRGRLNLHTVYNEAFQDHDAALGFAEAVKTVLLRELHVDGE